MEGQGRCVECHSEIEVPATYAHGDQIRCPTCGVHHKVLRATAGLKLVLADASPQREALRQNQQRIAELERELQRASASLGIGVNGLALGLLFVVARVGLEQKEITSGMLASAVAIAVVTGMLLELANYLFLAKRQTMTRLQGEIKELKADGRKLQQKIRDAARTR